MKVVVIGDIGWTRLYHLGDEAMTEAALEMLRQRGVDDVTLIAGHPQVAEAMYGHPAVPRFGFAGTWTRERLEERLAHVTGELDVVRPDEVEAVPRDIVSAVRSCDAVLIAGGGNLNSQHVHHLFERVALTRVARHLGKPLFVSSQTIGPMLKDEDLPLVKEILDYATAFGARESSTLELARSIAARPDSVVHVMDDAMMLAPVVEDYAKAKSLRLSERYVVGSFTGHGGIADFYYRSHAEAVARALDEIAVAYDADAALAPHAGSFDRTVRKNDQLAHDELMNLSTSRRMVHTEMLTAREAIALGEGALFTVSTRYHPVVFGPMRGTPAMALVTSYYSSVRMHGALSNVGLPDLAIYPETWSGHGLSGVVSELMDRREGVLDHLASVRAVREMEQTAWWDSLVEGMSTGTWAGHRDLSPVAEFEFTGTWAQVNRSSRRSTDLLGQAVVMRARADERAKAWKERAMSSEARRIEEASARRDAADQVVKGSRLQKVPGFPIARNLARGIAKRLERSRLGSRVVQRMRKLWASS